MFTVPSDVVAALEPFRLILGALATIGIFTMLYKENPIYRVCEYAYVGSASAHAFVTTFANTIRPGIETEILTKGQWWEIIPISLGLLIYCQPFRSVSWLSRYPMAFWVGYNAGYNLTLRVAMPLLTQVRQTMLPLIVSNADGFNLVASINNTVFCLSVLLTLIYFLFAVDILKGPAARLLNVSRMIIMVAFGAGFGTAVSGQVSLLIGRLDFLLSEWLRLY